MKLDATARTHLLALTVLGATVLLSKLWQGDMRGDSLLYAEVAKEILKTGDWLTMHFAYEPYFNKPPLLFWLTAINYKLFGVTSFSARFWSPFIAFLCGLALYLLASQVFDRKVAFLSAMILFMTRDFIKDNMGLRMDSTVILSIIAVLYFLLRGRGWKDGALAGMALGIGLLAKGLVALYSLGILLGLALVVDKGIFLSRAFLCYLLVGCTLFGLWFLGEYIAAGETFVNTFLFKQALGRFTGEFTYSKGKLYYLELLLKTYWPWLPLLPLGIYQVLRKASREQKALILSWVSVVALSLLFPQPEYGRYLMPLYPAFALAIGFFLSGLMKGETIDKLAKAALVGGTVAFFIINIFPLQLHKISYAKLRELKPLVDYHRAQGLREVYVYRTRYRTPHAVIFYLDVVPKALKSSADLPAHGLVIVESKRRGDLLRGPCTEQLYNGSYSLFVCR